MAALHCDVPLHQPGDVHVAAFGTGERIALPEQGVGVQIGDYQVTQDMLSPALRVGETLGEIAHTRPFVIFGGETAQKSGAMSPSCLGASCTPRPGLLRQAGTESRQRVRATPPTDWGSPRLFRGKCLVPHRHGVDTRCVSAAGPLQRHGISQEMCGSGVADALRDDASRNS